MPGPTVTFAVGALQRLARALHLHRVFTVVFSPSDHNFKLRTAVLVLCSHRRSIIITVAVGLFCVSVVPLTCRTNVLTCYWGVLRLCLVLYSCILSLQVADDVCRTAAELSNARVCKQLHCIAKGYL
jgi:hypothetical protein